MTYDMIFFPDYRAANPYQRLLYERLASLHPRPGTIDDALRLLEHASPGQRVIFHLHWEDALYRHLTDPQAAAASARSFLAKVEDFIGRGGTLIWTVHNHRSHLGAHPELDKDMRTALARLADRIHVHSLGAVRALRAEFSLPLQKLIVLPHGNYLPIHDPRGIDRRQARADRGFAEEEIVLLLFGRLDHYKGGLELLDAFGSAPDHWRLVMAGKQIAPLDQAIERLPPQVRARITLQGTFVPESEVAALVGAADVVVLPYRTIMTSGTLMLALSLGRPVVAPDLPAITEVVEDGREALLYPHQCPDGLGSALKRLATLERDDWAGLASQAEATGKLYDWAWIARQFGAALTDATRHERANRRSPEVIAPLEVPA